jgi:hypothetical protein
MEMEGIMKLTALWSPKGVCDHESLATSKHPCELQTTSERGISLVEELGVKGSDSLILKVTRPSERSFKPLLARLTPPPVKEFAWRRTVLSPGHIKEDRDSGLDAIPTTLDKFAAWWSVLGREPHWFAQVAEIAPDCKPIGVRGYACEVLDIGGLDAKGKAALGNVDAILRTTDTWTAFYRGESGKEQWTLLLTYGFPFNSITRVDGAKYWQGSVSQMDVLDLFPWSVAGDFKTSFPDLYQGTLGIQSLDFERILRYLESNSSSSSEVFEAFGLKIPAEQVTAWGTVVILCIQLYLFVYLRGLKRPLEPSDDAWNVGWFAANDAPLPRSIFFVTIWALPALTVILLAKHALDQRLQQASLRLHWGFLFSKQCLTFAHDFPAVPLILTGCCVSFLLGYLNWMSRPRIRMEPVPLPSQLFE